MACARPSHTSIDGVCIPCHMSFGTYVWWLTWQLQRMEMQRHASFGATLTIRLKHSRVKSMAAITRLFDTFQRDLAACTDLTPEHRDEVYNELRESLASVLDLAKSLNGVDRLKVTDDSTAAAAESKASAQLTPTTITVSHVKAVPSFEASAALTKIRKVRVNRPRYRCD